MDMKNPVNSRRLEMKNRMQSFVDRGNGLISKGKTEEAMKLISYGLQYYTNRIIKGISPYSKSDAGLLVIALRHLADQIEKKNQGAKEFAEGMSKCIVFPELEEMEKMEKANRH